MNSLQAAQSRRDHHESLLAQKSATRGLVLEKVLGDGDCFLYAALAAAGNSDLSPSQLRHAAVQWSKECMLKGEIEHVFRRAGGNDVDADAVEAWANELGTDKTDVDQLTVLGVTAVLRRTINVLVADHSTPLRHPYPGDDSDGIWVGLLPEIPDLDDATTPHLRGHYDALIPRSSPPSYDPPRAAHQPLHPLQSTSALKGEGSSVRDDELCEVPEFESGGFWIRRSDIREGFIIIPHVVFSDPGGRVMLRPRRPESAPFAGGAVVDADLTWIPLFRAGPLLVRRHTLEDEHVGVPHVAQVDESGKVTLTVLVCRRDDLPPSAPPPLLQDWVPIRPQASSTTDLRPRQAVVVDGDRKEPWMMSFDDLPRQGLQLLGARERRLALPVNIQIINQNFHTDKQRFREAVRAKPQGAPPTSLAALRVSYEARQLHNTQEVRAAAYVQSGFGRPRQRSDLPEHFLPNDGWMAQFPRLTFDQMRELIQRHPHLITGQDQTSPL